MQLQMRNKKNFQGDFKPISRYILTIGILKFTEIISSFNTFINEINNVWQSGDEKMESSGKNVRENGMEKIGSDHTSKI